ncbi:MAG TPA: pseudouridine synthase [Pyrinomonadaceae bacterium]|jgi:23S rRNA pseudouridine2605 synthase|nr:pseudouridine synthase [Pyrinomonadaceae bacterium]
MNERLQKLIAQAGIASRRQAEELIKEGLVTVNGERVTELGTKADPEKDHIKVRGKLINIKLAKRENVYVLLNKPKGYLSSAADPENRKLVVDLVPKSLGKLHPVGRLDYNTEGLIILTNDGDFTNLVASSKKIPKIYEVKVKGLPPTPAINKLRRGTVLEDGFKTAPAEIKALKATDNNGWYEVTLHEGHNQQIRKMFDAIGHSVVKLRRIAIGGLTDPALATGAYRFFDKGDVMDAGKFVKQQKQQAETKDKKGQAILPEHSRALKPKKLSKRRLSENERKRLTKALRDPKETK